MSRRGWFLRLRVSVIGTLSLMAVATGVLWGMSISSSILRPGNRIQFKLLYFEVSHGLGFRVWPGILSIHYSYPVEEPIDPNPSFLGTLRVWLQYFDATEKCDTCGARFRRGEYCREINSPFHGRCGNYGSLPAPKLNWRQKIVNWDSRVYNTVRSNTLDVRL